jgi:hypothetical protein
MVNAGGAGRVGGDRQPILFSMVSTWPRVERPSNGFWCLNCWTVLDGVEVILEDQITFYIDAAGAGVCL